MTTVKATYISTITVVDPDSKGQVEIEIWKDPESGALLGLDASFLDMVSAKVASPYNSKTTLDTGWLDGV